jgi:DNA-binding NtrC family response regulator
MSDPTLITKSEGADTNVVSDLDTSTFGLVVAWSAGEPQRVGEIILLPLTRSGPSFVFGRGESGPDDGIQQLRLGRQRPGSFELTPPIENAFISRKHLLLTPKPDGLLVENIGRSALLVGGRKVTSLLIQPGNLIEIKNQLVLLCVRRAIAMRHLRDFPAGDVPPFGQADADGFVGESPAAWELRDQAAFMAARSAHALILGESGTGKELVAQAIHARSSRRGKKLVARNAATLPPGLVDAELFGNVKNYPNPGMAERPGLIGEAHGSTLFLDEIGELPVELQAHLLRVLDEGGEYQRLGEATRRAADIRLIAATNRPLPQLKHDLVARFGLRIGTTGLNDRREDIPLLMQHLLRRTAEGDGEIGRRYFDKWDGRSGEPRVSTALVQALMTHRYTTHVRELGALLWRALSTSPGDRVDLTDAVRADLGAAASAAVTERTAPAEVTPEAIRESLAKNGGVLERVWRDLGLANRYVLKRLLKKHGIKAKGETGGDDEGDAGASAKHDE